MFLVFFPLPGQEMKIMVLAEGLSASPILLVTAISLLVTSALLTIGIICNRRNSSKGGKHLKGAGKANSNGRESYTILDAVCVGLMQVAAAVFPGLSRSGSTLAVGEMRGINKQKALDYTFVLGVPSIVAAALLEGIDAVKSPEGINVEIGVIIAGVIASAVVGYLAIVIFKWFLKSDKMSIFVIYTAIVGVAFIVISIIEMNTGVNLFTGAPLNI